MKRIIYIFILKLYHAGITVVSPWNEKARLWLQGRKHIFGQLRKAIHRQPSQDLIWMHCASLGEFEQGRPLLEAFRNRHPQAIILLTFFFILGL